MRDDMRRRVDGIRPRVVSPKPLKPKSAQPAHDSHPESQPVSISATIEIEKRETIRPDLVTPDASSLSEPVVSAPALPRSWEIPSYALKFGRRAALAGLIVVALAFLGWRAQAQAASTKESVSASLKVSEEALKQAKASLVGGDFQGAHAKFTVAQAAIHRANENVASRGQRVGILSNQTSGTVSAGQQFLSSAEELAGSGVALSGDLAQMRQGLEQHRDDLLKSGEVILSKMGAVNHDLSQAEDRLRLLKYTGEASDTGLTSVQLSEALTKLNQVMPQLEGSLATARQVSDGVTIFLGQKHFQQYLLWFQNPAELRATGGFVGTYGKLKLDNGAVKELSVNSIYAIANQANLVIKDKPPGPLGRFAQTASPIWALQDSNWSPDLSTAAAQFQKDYEKGGGSTSDGVIAITVNPIVEILKVVGPIDLPEYNFILSADNFQGLVQLDQQRKSELGDTDPKKILRDFLPKLLGKIGSATPDQQVQIAHIFANAVAAHDFQASFSNPELESLASQAHADGKLATGPGTFGLVDTNIAGFKSSTDITTRLDHHVVISPVGEVSGDIAVTRTYSGTSSDKPNTTFARLYLPADTKVDRTDGFNTEPGPVTTEQSEGHTVVGGWVDVDPGSSRQYVVHYILPKKLNLIDSQLPLLIHKQAGTSITYALIADLPDGYRWNKPASDNPHQFRLEQALDRDLSPGLTFRQGG